MSYELELEQGLSQQLNQFQIQSLNILALDNYELEQFMQNEFAENPMLEHHPSDQPPISKANAGGWKERKEMPWKDEAAGNRKWMILDQLNPSDYTKEQWRIMEYLEECVDDTGILDISMEQVSRYLDVSREACEWCWKELKKLDPPGVFARDLRECLWIQLERSGRGNEHLRRILQDHLMDVADGRISDISRDLNITTAQVRKYIFTIQSLNPRPLWGYSEEKEDYIIPDILLVEEKDQWHVELNDSWMGDYAMNDYYLKMFHQIEDPELKAYFRRKYERCCFIFRSIEQRSETILKICQAVVRRQEAYFLKEGKLQPMTMKEVADEIQMHVSTVSRAVKGKYIQSRRGTTGLREVFQSAASFGSKENTTKDIKEKLLEIIREEDASRPYSDQKLSNLLEQAGIRISRRTVAKYRKEMGIKGTYERKISAGKTG
ncbi:MAG TPA: RNA polymerase factor sigma-54 [Candidatus Anaerostipes avistercoris]|uniref:RNA polymerase factor sigma-54 n=1 Tax=Candidatus Anaerostipes avistercoris TaxID=2838462 RepID=A0A9D2PGG4_9FIRM|nr:RNA polymerase factor sigma-54 [Candidatus Anaerostipes avistercoris]